MLLQMNDDDFPNGFPARPERDGQPPPSSGLPAMPQLSSAKALPSAPNVVVTHVPASHRAIVHLGQWCAQLCCESPGYPRVDPSARRLSAGLVIRADSAQGWPPAAVPWREATPKGSSSWAAAAISPNPDDDPDPTKRPQLQSGRADLDQLLAAQTLSTAQAEVFTPAFVAAPDICNAAQRTLVYALVPTASSEASTLQAPAVAQLDHKSIRQLLPTLLKAGKHNAPLPPITVCGLPATCPTITRKANNASDFRRFPATPAHALHRLRRV